MKKLIYIAVLTFATPFAALLAQEYNQTLKGTVIDFDTKTSLPGATVVILGSDPIKGTITGLDGDFRLEQVPVGRHTLSVSYIGYEEVLISQVQVSTGREVVLNVEMKESVQSLKEVKVMARRNKSEAINQMASVSVNQITIESTSRIAAGINDPSRTAQSVAGVAAADDENNELVIRGNSPRGMLWRMEGIEIPNPNHFTNGEGGSGGGVSALSTQVLANSDFFTGAFSAEYGNALSGVMDLNLRKGNNEKREYAFQMGVMGAQAALEGPFKKGSQASYLFNYRYSTLKLLDKMGIDISGGDISPEWQDLSFKAYLPTKKAGYFSVWGLGGISSAGFTADPDTATWEFRGHSRQETEKHRVAVSGITHNYVFGNMKTYTRTVAALSHTHTDVVNDTVDFDFVPFIFRDQDLAYNTFSLSSYVNHKFNARHVIRGGAVFHRRDFDLRVNELDWDKGVIETMISDRGRTNMYESYIQYKFRPNEALDINAGLHATYLKINGDLTLEPRIGINWKVTPGHTLSAGAGLHSRIEPVSIYLASRTIPDGSTYQPNRNLKMTKAAHAVLGYNWNITSDLRLRTELYYQHLYDVPVMSGDTTNTVSALNFRSGFTNDPFENKGKGRNYGIELTLEKFFSQGWYMLATGSLFESKYTMQDGIERNTLFNSKYIANVVGGKEFKVGKQGQNVLGLNFRAILRGGYRTIPIDLQASLDQNREVRDYELAFETKVPDYFRMDIGVSYRRNKPSWSWVVSLDMQNFTNRLNVWDEFYSYELEDTWTLSMVGLVPVLNYRVEF